MDPGINEIVSVAFDPVTGRLAAAAASRQGIVYDFRESFASAAGNRELQRERLGADVSAGSAAQTAPPPAGPQPVQRTEPRRPGPAI
jgi:Ethanolamine utilization protein EutJ (predicted chaperonin)